MNKNFDNLTSIIKISFRNRTVYFEIIYIYICLILLSFVGHFEWHEIHFLYYVRSMPSRLKNYYSIGLNNTIIFGMERKILFRIGECQG